jgi:hypothetical protein
LNELGQFALRQERGGEVTYLQEWTDLPAAIGDADNLPLRLECAGDTIRLVIQNIILAEVTDSDPIRGDVALAARLDEAGEQIVAFDDLIVRVP